MAEGSEEGSSTQAPPTLSNIGREDHDPVHVATHEFRVEGLDVQGIDARMRPVSNLPRLSLHALLFF